MASGLVDYLLFTAEEINAHRSDRKEWHKFVRRREAEIAFSLFPDRRFQNALELGAGDGGQSTTIAKYCDRLICTEMNEKSYAWLGQSILQRQLGNVDYYLCDAQNLSRFQDGSFDLIFSSNMLEHIPDVDRCLKECRRVLKDDGLMLHTMPTRFWKVFWSVLNVLRRRKPGIHGISKSQFQEWRAFGMNAWRSRIESNGLSVIDIVGLPFYVGHQNSFIPIIKAGNAMNLSATYLYIVKKK